MEVVIESKLMEHEGGTKFYEVVQFINASGRRFAAVYRWGKMSAIRGGGETKVDRFTDARRCNEAARKKVNEKSGRGYSEARASFGLHPVSSLKVDDSLRLKLGEHYHDTETIDAIMNALGVDDVLTGSNADVALTDDVVVEEPAPEPERGDDWASW